MSLWSRIFGGGPSVRPLSALRDLVDRGLLTVALQPKNNALDLNSRRIKRLYVFLIDHDYPGGSAAMQNAVFARYGLRYRSCFMIGDPKNVAEIFEGLRKDPIYFGGGAGSGFKNELPSCLDALDQSAKTIGSVNVVARDVDRFVGYNTDGIGFVAGLFAQYPNCIAERRS